MNMRKIKREGELVMKTLAYRVYQSFLISPLLLYAITGNVKLSFSFGAMEFAVKLFSYYLFEKLWKVIGNAESRVYRKH